jgi:hypothetical protein
VTAAGHLRVGLRQVRLSEIGTHLGDLVGLDVKGSNDDCATFSPCGELAPIG